MNYLQYAAAMSKASGLNQESWGSALEAHIVSRLHGVDVHIFEEITGGHFERICHIHREANAELQAELQGQHIALLWSGSHFDLLEVTFET